MNVEISHTSDTVRLGDGTDLTLVNASGDLQVVNDHARSTIRLGDGTTLTNVTLTNELAVKGDHTHNNSTQIGDGTEISLINDSN